MPAPGGVCTDLFGPGQDKQDFLVFDFCGNLEYFSQNLPGSPGQVQQPLLAPVRGLGSAW
ncbi:MAG: hypothetical protein ACRCSN_16970 [Dermatophilaceae bacterium]